MKSAFLIVVHNKLDMLRILVKSLDYKDNDIFIHFDKKCEDVDLGEFIHLTKFSKVECLIDRISVSWGGVSQIECTLRLLKQALASEIKYDYFHLISGVDFPLMTNEDISAFLEKNHDREFVGFKQKDIGLRKKTAYCHFFSRASI